MSLEGLVITLTLLVVTGLWVAAPLLKPKQQQEDLSAQKQRERLLVHYERALNNIRDLDEDYATGKIQAEDYEQEREQWVQRGIQILMALDELASSSVRQKSKAGDGTRDDADVERSVDRQIEAAVSAYRSKSAKQMAKS